jgi:AraC-like DNA-binding protein
MRRTRARPDCVSPALLRMVLTSVGVMSGDLEGFAKAKKSREAANEISAQIEMELVRFDGENAHVDLNFDWSHETVWATQRQIADLFGVDRSVVTKHVANIFESGELEPKATCANFALVRLEGGRRVSREVEHYNLDVILSVGYRVSSAKATEFRKWATQTLRRYITDGFALNESRLRSDPNAGRPSNRSIRRTCGDTT